MRILLLLALSFSILYVPPLFALASSTTTPTGIPLSEIENRIGELVASYMRKFTPGTAIAVVYDGEIIFSRGYGYADIERQIPVDPATTVFEYGSISKLFVYMSVMQLVEQGLLDLDADIHVYLPEDLARKVNFQYNFSMRDLLNHSARFGGFNFNISQDAENVTTKRTLREALLATQPPQIFEPGTATAYATFSSALAAFIVSYIRPLAKSVCQLEIADPRNQAEPQAEAPPAVAVPLRKYAEPLHQPCRMLVARAGAG